MVIVYNDCSLCHFVVQIIY